MADRNAEVLSLLACWESWDLSPIAMIDLIEADSAHHCQSQWWAALSSSSCLVLSLALSYFFNSFALLSLPPELWCQAGQALMGRRRVVFIIMPFIYSCVCGQWQPCLCTALLSVCVLRDMTHFHFSLSLCSHHSPLLCQVLLSVSFKTDTRTHNTHQSHPAAHVSAQRARVNIRRKNRSTRAARVGQIASWPLLGGQRWLSISVGL